jgi:hypothetical protein
LPGLAVFDEHHGAVAVLVELADCGDVYLAVENGDGLWILQAGDERLGWRGR